MNSLEGEIAAIGFKRTGYGSGDLDYSIDPEAILRLVKSNPNELHFLEKDFHNRILDFIYEARTGKPRRRLFDFSWFIKAWPERRKYLLWPIRFSYSKEFPWTIFFQGHGWELESNKYGWTIHLGNLKVSFGSRKDVNRAIE